jgi:lipoyl-dependent peroxiredoxin
MKRSSTVVWKGNGPKGVGAITTQSGAFKEQPYSVNTRFTAEDGKAGTNPEELIAAAHASCYSMALAFALTGAGHEPTEIHTSATVDLQKLDAGWTITGIALDTQGKVAGITKEQFNEFAEGAKKNCPVSRALSATPITLAAKLL